MSRRVVIAVVLAVLVAPVAATPAAATPPDPPAAYYGEVVVNDSPAPAGVTVSAAVNGSVVETIETDASGAFGGSGAFDEKLVVNGESGQTQTVTLRVGGETVETVEWSSGDNRKVTLSLSDSTAPTAAIDAPDSVEAGVTVELDAAASDDVAVVDYEWTLPGGGTASGASTDVTFSEPGEQTIELAVMDAGGNTATASVTVDVTSSDDGSGDDGSGDDGSSGDGDTGGGQAGGGQSDDGEPADPTEPNVAVGADAVSVAFTELPANELATVELPDTASTAASGVEMDGLDVTTAQQANVSLDVSVSGEPPAGVELPGENTMAYVNVEESVSEDTLAGVDFSFGVSTQRLSEFDAAPEDVSLWRLHDGEWSQLDTRVAGETASGYEFVAESPGLSVFAVRAAAPDVSVNDAAIADASVEVGEEVSLSATLVNDGGADGTASVAFLVGGDQVAERTVSVPANDDRTVIVAYTPEESGAFEVRAGNVSAGTLDVSDAQQPTTQPPPDDQQEVTPPPTEEQRGFSPLTVAALGFVIAAMLGLFLLARRRA